MTLERTQNTTSEGSQPLEIEGSDSDCILVQQNVETIDLTEDDNVAVPTQNPQKPNNQSRLSGNAPGPIRNSSSSVRPSPYNSTTRRRPTAIIAPSSPTLSSVAATSSSSPSSSLSITCPVCLNDVEDSVATNCGHVFCEKCIKRHLQLQKNCPMCRKTLPRKAPYKKIFLNYN